MQEWEKTLYKKTIYGEPHKHTLPLVKTRLVPVSEKTQLKRKKAVKEPKEKEMIQPQVFSFKVDDEQVQVQSSHVI